MNRIRELVNYKNEIQSKEKSLKNIGVAVLDTGIAPHPDLNSCVRGFIDFVESYPYPYDDNGHGTHICGILCGNGSLSKGKYRGITQNVDLYMLKILDKKGSGDVIDMIRAMDWIAKNYKKYDIRIVNMSVGGALNMDIKDERKLLKGIENLWNKGLIIVTSAGNHGPSRGTITIPGVSQFAITVGSADDDIFKGKGNMETNYSGRGPTKDGRIKPNILAPGTYVNSCNYNYAYNRNQEVYIKKSGTSMATPVVTGAIAYLLGKNPQLSNEQVRDLLKESCVNIHRPDNEQGWGVLDIEKLIELAELI